MVQSSVSNIVYARVVIINNFFSLEKRSINLISKVKKSKTPYFKH